MFNTDTKKIDISSASKESLTFSYILEPKKYKEKRGSSYLVLEIAIQEELALKVAEIIKDIFESEYYKDPYKNPSYGPKSISNLFENAINAVNKSLATLETEGYVKWDNNIHVVICTIKNTEIHIAYTGNAHALLLRDGEFLPMSEKDNPKSHAHVFAQTVSGVIKAEDIILLTTPELLNYLSREKIKRSLINKGLAETQKEIEGILSEIDMTDALSTLFVEIQPKTDLLAKKDEIKPLREPVQDGIIEDYPSIPLPEKESKPTPEPESHKAPFLFGKKIKDTFAIPNSHSQPLSSESYTDPIPQQKVTALQKIRKSTQDFFDQYINTKARGKYFGIAAGAIGLILVITIGSTILSGNRKEAEAKLAEVLSDASSKEQEAANAIIYRDYKTAELYLNDAQKRINEELTEEQQEAEEVKEIQKKLALNFDKINKINRIQPEQIAAVNSSFNALFGDGNQIFATTQNEAKIFQFSGGSFEELSQEADGISNPRFGVFNEKKNTVALLTENSIAEMPLFSKKISIVQDEFPKENHNFVDMTLYEDKIYLLDPATNQIYRHTRAVDGYALGKEWITDKTVDIKNATSFSIDANIYVINTDGLILKLASGKQEPFQISGFSDTFSENTKLKTALEFDNLYVLDIDHKILAVFSKKGNLINQYAIETDDTLKDFLINEEEQKATILGNNSLYSISISN